MAVTVGIITISFVLFIFLTNEVIEYIKTKHEASIKEKKKEKEKLQLLVKLDRSKEEMDKLERNMERLRIKHSR